MRRALKMMQPFALDVRLVSYASQSKSWRAPRAGSLKLSLTAKSSPTPRHRWPLAGAGRFGWALSEVQISKARYDKLGGVDAAGGICEGLRYEQSTGLIFE